MHLWSRGEGDGPRAQLLASGVAVPWAMRAQEPLKEDWGVVADVWSVTRGRSCAGMRWLPNATPRWTRARRRGCPT